MTATIKFYTDEHIPKAVIRGLRARGMDVLTTKEAGMLGASDEEHLNFALLHDRVIFTHDTDFLILSARGLEHAGIVYAHQHTSIGELIQGLVLLFQVLDAKDMKKQVEYL